MDRAHRRAARPSLRPRRSRAIEARPTRSRSRTGLELERVYYDETLRSEDRLEALRAFAEKRKPAFRGR